MLKGVEAIRNMIQPTFRMRNERQHSAWLLLVLFVAGGLVAPSVHNLQHAWQAPASWADTSSLRGDLAGPEGTSVGEQVFVNKDLVCPPYHSLFFGVQFQELTPVPGQALTALVPLLESHLFSSSFFRRLIRGPPVR